MYRFTFDHAMSDGARGYGCVVIEHDDDVWYIGRGFAPTVLVERFETGLTYDQARDVVAFLSVMPTGARSISVCTDPDTGTVYHHAIGGTCWAAPSALYCECHSGDIACNYDFASFMDSRSAWGDPYRHAPYGAPAVCDPRMPG